jgi:dTDP-4-dehydrorhamnose reductase
MKKILIIGSKGFLGSEIYQYFKSSNYKARQLSFSCEGKEQVDFTDLKDLKEKVLLDLPDIIINCAALVDITTCEENKLLCYEQNVLSVFNLIKISNENSIKLIHFSTDYVFDSSEEKKHYDSSTNPLNYYGVSKLESEKLITNTCKDYIILRPTILFGPDHLNRKKDFISKIINSKNTVQDNLRVKYPIYTRDISRIIYQLIEDDIENDIIHLVPPYSYSKFEIANLVKNIFELNSYIQEGDEPSFPLRPKHVLMAEDRYNLKYTPFLECLEEIKKGHYENS